MIQAAVIPLPSTKGSRVLAQWNAERRAERAAREQQAKYTRAFAGAAINRLTASMASWSGAVNSDLDNGLVILRSRARALCANNEFGRRFLSLVSTNIVGADGPKLQVRLKTDEGRLDTALNDAVESHWAAWCRQCEITGRVSFPHLLRVVTTSAARDGESLLRFVRARDLPYGLTLQLLEADRLDESINQTLRDGNIIRMGVEQSAFGKPVAFHVKSAHPGENYQSVRPGLERIPASDLLHVYVLERAEQTRGYTWMHAVLIRMDMLHGFEEAAVIAARVGASKMGFFTRDENSDPSAGAAQIADSKDGTTGIPQISADPGEFLELPIGYDLKTWDPDYPHQNFESFLKACVRSLSTGLNVAAHNLSGDMTDVNYSSARIAELAERDVWKTLQNWLIDTAVWPIYREWLRTALASGTLTFPSGLTLPAGKIPQMYDRLIQSSRFQPRTWQWVDPTKDVQAAKEQISAGLASRTQFAASQGREFEEIIDELKQEQEAINAAGLKLDMGKASQKDDTPDQKEAAA